ncbi:mechanosensitive ion channel domain-containing protein [Sulfurospirillum arcachonense]|uniref:mechanosensitive ion channel domain-containing protein n=1 Tax=Sulfurospirillum arcachonense TaxID=57666 RepID=UPI00046A274F|nr:mechanosensitive ion channel domain-containing protein [Sulfurospirillum arcachonense]
MLDQNIILTLVLIISTFISLNGSKYFLKKIGNSKRVSQKRIYYVSKSISIFIVMISVFVLALIWSVSFDGVMVFASSIFAVIGVALFAQWSILSNLTSSIIIFFSFPSRVGDYIRIVDGDNSIEGKIVEIELFHIRIIDKDNNIVIYPNNLFMQKPVIKLHKKIETKKDLDV